MCINDTICLRFLQNSANNYIVRSLLIALAAQSSYARHCLVHLFRYTLLITWILSTVHNNREQYTVLSKRFKRYRTCHWHSRNYKIFREKKTREKITCKQYFQWVVSFQIFYNLGEKKTGQKKRRRVRSQAGKALSYARGASRGDTHICVRVHLYLYVREGIIIIIIIETAMCADGRRTSAAEHDNYRTSHSTLVCTRESFYALVYRYICLPLMLSHKKSATWTVEKLRKQTGFAWRDT